ncbi:hypothetical protein L6452_30989 [Arctium lappa]|uniref:Uncharacterized protein n=1 Tax=Arctium lappa TaxID=4217 RepID=A0ACB8ZIT9_ARCLA|nr:hypothetical protein L6452_30989 [Arctium lappa]
MLSGLSYSYREEFLDNNSKANIVEISEVVEVKSLIIFGTVKAFSKDIPWFYMGCKRCSRKVRPTYIVTDKNDGSGQVEETEKFECDSVKCKGKDTDVLPKFKIPLRVQDDTGIISLTLFDREANKVLNKSAIKLYEKIKEHGDLEMFPEDLNVLRDRKFAIKIEVNNYNIKNSCFVYVISKVTDYENILNELEMRFSAQRDAVSFTGENATPSNVDKSTTDSSVSQEKTYQKKICKSVDLKRDFDEIYDAGDAMNGSANNFPKTCIPIEKEEEVTNMIIPKLEMRVFCHKSRWLDAVAEWKSCLEIGAFDGRCGRDVQKQEHCRCCSGGVKSGRSVLFLIINFGVAGYVSCSHKRVVGRMDSFMIDPLSS